MAAEQAPRRPPTRRVELARLAAQVIALDSAVEPTAGDGRWVTGDGEGKIRGVVCSESAQGRIDVELHLVAHWPSDSLERVAAGLRASLADAARAEGLSGAVGAVDVAIHDLVMDERAGGRPR